MRRKQPKKGAAPGRAAGRKISRKGRAPAAQLAAGDGEGKLTFNHAMIYVRDVERSLRFYRELLGFKLIDDFKFENQRVYARLRAPGGECTIALHLAGPSDSVASNGVRLYFEIRDLDDFCRDLMKQNFYITKMPAMMPWGWRHAYLNDPDGHEISLYWAAGTRMKKTMMKAQKAVSARPRRR